jgi:hypothetical protein
MRSSDRLERIGPAFDGTQLVSRWPPAPASRTAGPRTCLKKLAGGDRIDDAAEGGWHRPGPHDERIFRHSTLRNPRETGHLVERLRLGPTDSATRPPHELSE